MSEAETNMDGLVDQAMQHRDVITAGLATGSQDFETLRAEAGAMRDVASQAGLRRLVELGGLMESDLADAARSGELKDSRAEQISEAAEALSDGIRAAAAGEEEPPDVGRSLAQLFSI